MASRLWCCVYSDFTVCTTKNKRSITIWWTRISYSHEKPQSYYYLADDPINIVNAHISMKVIPIRWDGNTIQSYVYRDVTHTDYVSAWKLFWPRILRRNQGNEGGMISELKKPIISCSWWTAQRCGRRRKNYWVWLLFTWVPYAVHWIYKDVLQQAGQFNLRTWFSNPKKKLTVNF